jgi:hypothetical protein
METTRFVILPWGGPDTVQHYGARLPATECWRYFARMSERNALQRDTKSTGTLAVHANVKMPEIAMIGGTMLHALGSKNGRPSTWRAFRARGA